MIAGLTMMGLPFTTRLDKGGEVQWGGKVAMYVPAAFPIDRAQVDLCKVWIRQFCVPRKTLNLLDSYALKHVVERYYGDYIANGAFIAAAEEMGYESSRSAPNSPNAKFKMGIKNRRPWDGERRTGFAGPYKNERI